MAGRRGERRSTAMQVAGWSLDLRKSGVARFDLRDPYHLAMSLSWPAFVIGAFALMGSIHVFFALLYLASPGSVTNLAPGDFLSALFFSIETLATVGYGEMAPAGRWGHAVASAEIISGMSLTAILTGLLFVRFSKPKAHIVFADKAVVAAHNGVPTLMVRIANSKLTMLSAAQAKLGLLMVETTDEGHTFRRTHDLVLQRSDLLIFPLTWTLMHTIDGSSPLARLDRDELKTREARMFLMVEAHDVALDVQVRAIKSYAYDDVAFGMRYADAVIQGGAGHAIADLGRLSALEAEGGATAPA